MKTNLTLVVEYLTYRYLYLKRGYRLGIEVDIPYDLTKRVIVEHGATSLTPRVDIMGVNVHSQVVCVEVKTTLADFKSKNGHNFFGHYNYYAVPLELVDKIKDIVPKHVGIIAVDPQLKEVAGMTYYVDPITVKPARKQNIDFNWREEYSFRGNLLEQVQYKIVTAQTSSVMTLMKNNIERLTNE